MGVFWFGSGRGGGRGAPGAKENAGQMLCLLCFLGGIFLSGEYAWGARLVSVEAI